MSPEPVRGAAPDSPPSDTTDNGVPTAQEVPADAEDRPTAGGVLATAGPPTGTDGAPTATAGADPGLVRRLTLLATCLFLTAIAFSVDPRNIVGDTKIDLTINPFGFMERALYLWDAAYYGQVQNQAYGYLFPNGPFHALFLALDMPEWVVQRLWMAVLLCAAFLGTVQVARALGIGSLHTQILAGVGYALAPRVLTLLSFNSAELQPTMLLPWVLLPLIHGAQGRLGPRRAAALSAVVFLLCGGTNAASELAILVVPGLFLLTRRPGPRSRRLLAWWLVAIALVSFWWLVPLLIMGRYVFSFMPYTEDAGTTTSVTSLADTLRGASNWMGYVQSAVQPALPAGAELSTTPWLVAATAVVAGLGLAGLASRRMPERVFLALTLVCGVAIVTSGYTGELSGPFSQTMEDLYNGVLGPFRNVHKFDALVRLPLVLGLAHLPLAVVARAAGSARTDREATDSAADPPNPDGTGTDIPGADGPTIGATEGERAAGAGAGAGDDSGTGVGGGPGTADPDGAGRPPRRVPVSAVVGGTCAVALLATLTPVATVGIASRGGFTDIPHYWQEATTWLDAQDDPGMTLAVPGSARGEYMWGRPMDEPMQPLMDGRWTNHQIIPWGSPGASRTLHEIDQRLSSGRGSAGLADTLARMGVSHLLVRNDLQREGNNDGWPARVHQALTDSPGITHVQEFGPVVGSLDPMPATRWYDQPQAALDVYAVNTPAPLVGTVPQDDAVRVTGGPEALLALAEEGLLTDDRPVLLGDDPGAADIAPENTIVTDTARLREVEYPEVRRNVTATRAADEDPDRDFPAPDIADPAWDPYTVAAAYRGIADVTASSTEAGARVSSGNRDPGRTPFAALDGDTTTAWRSTGLTGAVGEWLEVELTEPQDLTGLTIAFEEIPGTPPPAAVDVITDAGSRTVTVADTAEVQELAVPPGETTRVRIRVAELAWEPEMLLGSRVGITHLEIPGVRPARTLDVPGTEDARTIVLTGSTGTVPGCMAGSHVWVCSEELEVQGEDARLLDRVFDIAPDAAGEHHVSGRVVATDTHTLQTAANRATSYPRVASSSTAIDHPATLARNAFDGDDLTAWYPDPDDPAPSIDVTLGATTEIGGLRVDFARADAVTSPVGVTIETPDTSRYGWLDSSGTLGFADLETDELTITFHPPTGQPLAVQEIVLPGIDPVPPIEDGDTAAAEDSTGGECGRGPLLRVNGERVETRIVEGGLADELAGRPLEYESCTPVELSDGENRVTVGPSDAYRVESAVVRHGDLTATSDTTTEPRSEDGAAYAVRPGTPPAEAPGGEAGTTPDTGGGGGANTDAGPDTADPGTGTDQGTPGAPGQPDQSDQPGAPSTGRDRSIDADLAAKEERAAAVGLAAADVLGWGPSQRSLDVDVAEDSYLVVNENFNEGWQATVAGDDTPLTPVRLDGWRQAWELPAGTTGTVTLNYTPDTAYHAALVSGAVLALVVVASVLVPTRRVRPGGGPPLAPVGPLRIGPVLLTPLGLLLGLWTAGVVGVALVALVLLVAWWPWRRRRPGHDPEAQRHRTHGPAGAIRSYGALLVPAGTLAIAGVALGAGTYLSRWMPLSEVTEWLADPLTAWAPQILSLLALATLIAALRGAGAEGEAAAGVASTAGVATAGGPREGAAELVGAGAVNGAGISAVPGVEHAAVNGVDPGAADDARPDPAVDIAVRPPADTNTENGTADGARGAENGTGTETQPETWAGSRPGTESETDAEGGVDGGVEIATERDNVEVPTERDTDTRTDPIRAGREQP